MNRKLIFILFIMGFIFRISLTFLFPQPFEFDQVQYHDFAMGILKHGIYAQTFRLYGYPLFIAIIYFITGIVSQVSKLPWQIVQAFLDCLSGYLVYLIALKIFAPRRAPAIYSYIIYLFNPFTAAYTGVMLSEVLLIFVLLLAFYLFTILLEKSRVHTFFVLAFLLGYLPQIRPEYILFGAGLLFFVLVRRVKKWNINFKNRREALILSLCIFFLPFVYNFIGNFIFFRQFALTTVDNVFIENLYMSLYMEKVPRRDTSIFSFPKEVREAYNEFSYTESKKERIAMSKKYTALALAEIKREPLKFIKWRIAKLWYVWEKNSILLYRGPDAFFTGIIYWGNIVLLFLALTGFVLWFRKIEKKEEVKLWFGRLVALFFAYVSLSHITSFADGRFSIPFYPFFCLYLGYFLWVCYGKCRDLL